VAEETELKFERGDAGANALQEVLDEIAVELRTPNSEADAAAKEAGLDSAELADIQLVAREDAQALDPLSAAILIGVVSNLGSDAIEKLWNQIIWPRLKRRLGARAVGDRVK